MRKGRARGEEERKWKMARQASVRHTGTNPRTPFQSVANPLKPAGMIHHHHCRDADNESASCEMADQYFTGVFQCCTA